MNIESIKSMMDDFDPASKIPSLESLIRHIPQIVRWAVLAGPVCLLIFGVLYLFLPPKEANHALGFRSHRGMASVEAWQFTQFIAGCVWILLGLGLGLWVWLDYRDLGLLTNIDMMFKAIRTILREICYALGGSVLVRLMVILFFDFRGNRRRFRRPSGAPKRKAPGDPGRLVRRP